MRDVITVDPLDSVSIDMAIHEIESHKRSIQEKALEVCRRLAEIGAKTASDHYASGFLDGNDDVTVTIEPLNDGYLISANGESVCFLEFGTGVAAGNGYDTEEIAPPVSIEPGSWSSTEGSGQFAKNGYWYYNGQKFLLTTPRMGMYHASVEIKRKIAEIAKEVFSS